MAQRSEPEPLARAFRYVRLGPDAELGLLRQSRAIERVCSQRGIALEGLLSDEPGSAGDPGPALRRALGRIVAGGRVAPDALRAAGEHERRMLQERTRRGLDAAGQKGARPARPAVADRPSRKRSSLDARGRARARMSREDADVRNGTVAYTRSGRTSPAISLEMGHIGAMHRADRGLSRTQFIAAGAVAAGAAAAVGVAGGPLEGTSAQPDRDIEALQLILLLEYTENAFYAEAIERGGLSGEMKDYAQAVLAHEREHLAFLKQALGAQAEDRPSFEFGSATRDPTEFAATAAELEDLAVGAYNGQATNVSRATLEAAATVVSVEARHAAWIRSIVGEPPAPDATDKPLSAAQVREGLERIGMR